MRLKMAKNSVFAYLLRSPWWLSVAVAFLLASAAQYFLGEHFGPVVMSIALPFLVIGVVAGWRQLRMPSDARIEATLAAIAAMSWPDFSTRLKQALERDGFVVSQAQGAADFVLEKNGRRSLLSAKRWKAANHGLEPLQALETARKAQGVNEAIYVATGRLSDKALHYASAYGIVVFGGSELARLLRF